jgi:hypothetical protein
MEDPEISGEVLIPFENGQFLSDKHPPSFQDLSSCSFKSFRNVLFQGESLRIFIVLKSSKQKSQNITEFFDKIFFKIEFEPNDLDKNLNINENEEENDNTIDNKEINFNFYSSNKNTEENNINREIKNNEFEEVKNKIYDEESCTEIYEIIKEVIVPENNINYNFLMKINLYLENYNIFSENKESNILNFYQLGLFDNINNYRYFKIFFKEVKIINALNILNIKQIDPKINTSFIQTKISNYNNSYEFCDTVLKNSKIFKNMKIENEGENKDKKSKNIRINDIRILKYESCFDEIATEEIEFIKEKLIKEKKLINKDDYEISIFNKNKFPYIIGSGEEFNLLFKITKNSYINESINSTNKINKNTTKEKNKQLRLLTEGEISTQDEVSKIIINSMNDSFLRSSMLFNSRTLSDDKDDDSSDSNPKKKNSVMISQSQSKSITEKIQQPILSLGNLIKKKITFSDSKEENKRGSNENIENNSLSYKNMDTHNTKIFENEIINESENVLNLDSYFDENFRIYYITPILLELTSDLFYENINMSFNMKWFNEINRYLKIFISIPEHIYINRHFEIKIKIKNISFNPMNLIIQIKDNETKETPISLKNKKKIIENVPSILSQTKIEHFGLIDCGDEKVYQLKFLPYIKGYCYLPNLTLVDIYSDKSFYIVQNNKLYVEENKL